MVHDRRIDGKTEVFGNAGALFMNAMTWYDHDTSSIWSQPWGRGIEGELKGLELFPLPGQVTTWKSWKNQHPQTLVMTNDLDRLGSRRQGFSPNFVIGIFLDDSSRAYYFKDVADAGIINDTLNDIPILIWAEGETYNTFVRQVGDQLLEFQVEGDKIVDTNTGSTWDLTIGLATAGDLQGEGLQPVPSTSSYDWAWLDFYPSSTIFER